MNKAMRYLLMCLLVSVAGIAFSAEPDESGIGGTGVSKPQIDTDLFDRPEIPDVVDVPEVPEHAVPEIDVFDRVDDGSEFEQPDVQPADAGQN